MIRQQDRTIDSIAGTLSTLAQQAGLMGQEILEHNEYVVFSCFHLTLLPSDFLCSPFLFSPSALHSSFHLRYLYLHRMLDDLESSVDRTDTNLNSAMLKLRSFMRRSEDKYSGWCVIILIIVLCILLLVVILI
jgi:hypothetical protein